MIKNPRLDFAGYVLDLLKEKGGGIEPTTSIDIIAGALPVSYFSLHLSKQMHLHYITKKRKTRKKVLIT